MSFTVRILGTGSATPTLKRGASSHFVNCKQRNILIDCGEGTQIQMRKFNVKFQKLDIVLITHLHGDHIFGLPGLISTMHLLGRTRELKIVGPVGIKNFFNNVFDLSEINTPFPLIFSELEVQTKQIIFEDNYIKISCFPLKHRISTFAYRIDTKPGKRHLNKTEFDKTGISFSYIEKLLSGNDIMDNNGTIVKWQDVTLPPDPIKSYAFCSDTIYFPKIADEIKNVDLLYHEATFIEKDIKRAKTTYHSTALQAATIAKEANVKKLILGHFSARYKNLNEHLAEAKNIFKNTTVLEDGNTIIL